MNYQTLENYRKEFYKILAAPLTEETVGRAVELIGLVKSDDEVAHLMEDDLHQEVLNQLKSSIPIAAIALQTQNLDFSRWYA